MINRQSGSVGQFVNCRGVETHRLDQHFIICVRFPAALFGRCRFFRGLHQMFNEWTEFTDDICSTFDKLCALPDELMAATRQRIMYRTGDGEYLAALFCCEPCTDKGAAALRRFNDQSAKAESADQPVSLREVFAARFASERKFRAHSAIRNDSCCELRVSCRIHLVDSVAKESNRHCAAVECPLMSGSVNASRKAADDAEAGTAKMFRKFVGILAALPGWISAADNRQRRQVQRIEVSGDEKPLRRIGDLAEQAGKVI